MPSTTVRKYELEQTPEQVAVEKPAEKPEPTAKPKPAPKPKATGGKRKATAKK